MKKNYNKHTPKESVIPNQTVIVKESLEPIQSLIKERILFLERIVQDYESSFQHMPDGSLGVIKHGNRYQYYWKQPNHASSDNLPKRTYIKNSEISLASSLAQKSYLKQAYSLAKKELKLLYPLVDLDKAPLVSLYHSLPEFRQKLITPYAIPDNEFIDLWNNISYHKHDMYDETLFITNRNERVRSKIEVNIANMLDKYNVPYKYEYPMSLVKGETIYPDFLCLNVRTRKEIIWEHFGMMDDIGYLRKNYAKLQSYQLHGYMLGKNLITTFETSKQPLDSRIIKATIETYLM
ncbi:hypothetical protein SAMN02910275_01085 [Butyrivibrio sp. INlla18]|uniref:hypothetical protein n=1 Tax=Butyrivibrio sp. INlla18 TaxID=1520806 RepID=UPI000889AF28|nr:hypothetical protein [Butyrivibrio sp. INlla18]SDA53741.1 hypothetical protein SAMN02910275_01085 [Butyrivibrio sp. INlla18]